MDTVLLFRKRTPLTEDGLPWQAAQTGPKASAAASRPPPGSAAAHGRTGCRPLSPCG